MEKIRVKKGEAYWHLSGVHNVERGWDNYGPAANLDFVNNNYFNTQEEAEAMARKIRAVLKGADVIEWPSEEEFYKVAPSTNKLGGYSLANSRQVQGFQDCWDWIKSKIVK